MVSTLRIQLNTGGSPVINKSSWAPAKVRIVHAASRAHEGGISQNHKYARRQDSGRPKSVQASFSKTLQSGWSSRAISRRPALINRSRLVCSAGLGWPRWGSGEKTQEKVKLSEEEIEVRRKMMELVDRMSDKELERATGFLGATTHEQRQQLIKDWEGGRKQKLEQYQRKLGDIKEWDRTGRAGTAPHEQEAKFESTPESTPTPVPTSALTSTTTSTRAPTSTSTSATSSDLTSAPTAEATSAATSTSAPVATYSAPPAGVKVESSAKLMAGTVLRYTAGGFMWGSLAYAAFFGVWIGYIFVSKAYEMATQGGAIRPNHDALVAAWWDMQWQNFKAMLPFQRAVVIPAAELPEIKKRSEEIEEIRKRRQFSTPTPDMDQIIAAREAYAAIPSTDAPGLAEVSPQKPGDQVPAAKSRSEPASAAASQAPSTEGGESAEDKEFAASLRGAIADMQAPEAPADSPTKPKAPSGGWPFASELPDTPDLGRPTVAEPESYWWKDLPFVATIKGVDEFVRGPLIMDLSPLMFRGYSSDEFDHVRSHLIAFEDPGDSQRFARLLTALRFNQGMQYKPVPMKPEDYIAEGEEFQRRCYVFKKGELDLKGGVRLPELVQQMTEVASPEFWDALEQEKARRQRAGAKGR